MAIYKLLFKENHHNEIMYENTECAPKTRGIKIKSYQEFLSYTETAKNLAKELSFNIEAGVYDGCVGYICLRTHRFVFEGGSKESADFISLISNSDEYTFRLNSACQDPIFEIRLWYQLG